MGRESSDEADRTTWLRGITETQRRSNVTAGLNATELPSSLPSWVNDSCG